MGDVGNAKDAGDAGEAGDKEAGRDKEEGEPKYAKVSNNEKGHNGDQDPGKGGYDEVGDGVGVDGVLEDVELDNNSVGDGAGN